MQKKVRRQNLKHSEARAAWHHQQPPPTASLDGIAPLGFESPVSLQPSSSRDIQPLTFSDTGCRRRPASCLGPPCTFHPKCRAQRRDAPARTGGLCSPHGHTWIDLTRASERHACARKGSSQRRKLILGKDNTDRKGSSLSHPCNHRRPPHAGVSGRQRPAAFRVAEHGAG